MSTKIVFAAIALASALFSSTAVAATCSAPSTLANGQPANAGDVVGIITCINTYVAPLASPSFTGVVGIGTTSPETSLMVNGTLETANQGRFQGWYVNGTGPALETGFIGGSAEVVSYNRTTAAYQPLLFEASAHHFTIGGSEKVTITGGGNVGIGTTSPSQILDVNGTIRQRAVASCSLVADSSGNIVCTSDANLKQDIAPYAGGLATVTGINPVTFQYRGETYTHVGFIAQNVQTVLPQATPRQSNGFLGLDSNAILAASVNAIKELKVSNDRQSKVVQDQQSQIQALAAADRAQAVVIRQLQTQVSALLRKSGIRTAAN